MIRKINYTDREKLKRSDAQVALTRAGGNRYQVDAKIDLARYALPATASVLVEAYHGPLCERYHWGFVGQAAVPDDRVLPMMADPETIMFRVKIVDERERHGRIIAVADRIQPQKPNETESNRVSLLPVVLDAHMGERIWKVDFEADMPELHVNKHIEDMKAEAKASALFHTLVFPEVVSEVLRHIIVVDEHTDPYGDEEDWRSLWLRFVLNLPGVPADVPEIDADVGAWIDSAVAAFCAYHRTRQRYAACLEKRNNS